MKAFQFFKFIFYLNYTELVKVPTQIVLLIIMYVNSQSGMRQQLNTGGIAIVISIVVVFFYWVEFVL